MKNRRLRQLGMHKPISRRDFMHGVGVGLGGSLLPSLGLGDEMLEATSYPPALTGMRGAHAGSFEIAHALRDGAAWKGNDTGERYDLVVVGGGISGLSAAYFFRQQAGPDARILVLDNHDDFGGHAKRNEFDVDGRSMIGYGGTMLIEAPGGYPPVAKRLIRELGIDTDRFYTAFHHDLYESHGLGEALFLRGQDFGRDHLAVGDLTDTDTLDRMPLSADGRRELERLFANDRHYLTDMSRDEQIEYLQQTSYATYLRERGGFGDEVLKAIAAEPRGVWATGIEAFPALAAWSSAYPGFGDLSLGFESYAEYSDEPTIFHFPDGNASVARLLVRSLIPRSAPGDGMEDIVTARFDYSRLDEEGAPVRLRLNSTAVRVRHVDDELNSPVHVTYVRDGKPVRVTADRVVLACNHSVIPYLCPEMQEEQRRLLSSSLRAPLVYTNVVLRNWQSFVKLGFHRANCPGSYFHRIMLDWPVSLGDYRFPQRPDEPIVLHMNRIPGEDLASARQQFLSGQRELVETSFATFEFHVRDQLRRMLGDGGFDPARDIAAITVNRWPHGYAYGYDAETDRVAFDPSLWPPEKRHWERASQPFGRISIAATDAASNAMTEAAIEEAHRAVSELAEAG